jgi:hypothetical protein
MNVRTPLGLLLVLTVALAVLPSIRGIAAGWAADDGVPTTAAAPGAPASATVETTAFALG